MLVLLLGCFFPFSTRPCFIQQMGWVGHREWPAVHFFCISSYAHHSLYDLYLTYHTSPTPCTELWINICFLSLVIFILHPCNLKLSCLSLHLPHEKKNHIFLIITLCLGSQRQGSLAGVTRGNSVEARIAKKEQEIFFLFYQMSKMFSLLQWNFCGTFSKLIWGVGWGRDFESEREREN